MLLSDKHISNLTLDDINGLIDHGVPESSLLDYKLELPKQSNGEKKEFLADISSFANTSGGIIIYGIKEGKGDKKGVPEQIVGLPNLNFDEEKLRLESMLQDGIQPRITHFEFKKIEVSGKDLLLIGIPRSLFAPHIIWFQKNGKFYKRNNSGKYQMDIFEIKQLFLQTSEWEKEAESFRRQRIMDVRLKKYIPNLNINGSTFIHIIPMGSRDKNIDLNRHKEKFQKNPPPGLSSYDYRFNIDGYLVYPSHQNPCESYIQYFKNGAIELYTSKLHLFRKPSNLYSGEGLETFVFSNTKNALQLIDSINVSPPLIIYISIINILNFSIIVPENMEGPVHNCIDREEMLLPGDIIDNMSISLEKIMLPTINSLWQSAGWTKSPFFNEKGERRI